MKEVVVMPTLKRPEMLALSLEKINQSNNPPDDIRIFLDTCTEEQAMEVEFVRDEYCPHAMIYRAQKHIEMPGGMWNILMSLKQGYETGADLIWIIEEDVLVKSESFNWHRQAQASGDYLATCGRKIPRLPNYNQYTNPGSCFKREMLVKVVEHIKPELFIDRRKYMDEQFGRMDEISDLDDGLIRRIARFNGLKVLYPSNPTCYHIGFRAYNHFMNWVNEGNIQERITGLRKMLPTIDPNCKYTGDFEQ